MANQNATPKPKAPAELSSSELLGRVRELEQECEEILQYVRELREALVYIRDHHGENHIDDDGGDVDQEPECWCARCVAVRALSPNEKLSDPAE